jgi:hypothetical protein
LDTEITDHFADIIALAQATFEHVDYVTDATPSLAILRLNAKSGHIGKEHAGEHIPHLHQEDKTELSLTEITYTSAR